MDALLVCLCTMCVYHPRTLSHFSSLTIPFLCFPQVSLTSPGWPGMSYSEICLPMPTIHTPIMELKASTTKPGLVLKNKCNMTIIDYMQRKSKRTKKTKNYTTYNKIFIYLKKDKKKRKPESAQTHNLTNM